MCPSAKLNHYLLLAKIVKNGKHFKNFIANQIT